MLISGNSKKPPFFGINTELQLYRPMMCINYLNLHSLKETTTDHYNTAKLIFNEKINIPYLFICFSLKQG